MKTKLIHTLHDAVELRYKDQSLFSYAYVSRSPALESTKPYFHPLKTLAGNDVSLYRPHDHLWHTGLTMTSANLSGENFWGGATYTRGIGYVQSDNNGSIQHTDWQELLCDSEDNVHCVEHLKWTTHRGEVWIVEARHIDVHEINVEAGYWSLDLSFHLFNVAEQPLVFGSPTTEGRLNAGYGGLFWRGPRSFLHGKILGANGLKGPDMMGQASPWLAFTGWHDGNHAQSTLVFIDQPANPHYPNKWFVRNNPYAGVSCSFMFDEPYTLQPQESLELTYRIVIADGGWERTQIEEYIAAQTEE